jgi:hypothetical protein
MDVLGSDKKSKSISLIYFCVAFVLLIIETVEFQPLIYFFKPLLIPILIALYFFSFKKRNWIYVSALLFSFFSNVFLLEITQERLLHGVMAYTVCRFLTVVLVYRTIKIKNWLSITIASSPFLFIALYLINLTQESLFQNFYPLLINGLLMSFLGGLSLSNYIFEESDKNSWLLISSLLFVAQIFIFVIQKYYLFNEVFQPISVIIYAISHYTFYKFVILNEETQIRM